MRVSVAIAVLLLVLLQLHLAAGKKDKGEGKEKKKDGCDKWKKNLKNCLKKGWNPSSDELDIEECPTKNGKIKGKKLKKCEKAETSYLKAGCPPLCKKEEEEIDEGGEEEEIDEGGAGGEEEGGAGGEEEGGAGGEEEGGAGGEIGGQCVKNPATVAECMLNGQALPAAQMTPGYYNGIPDYSACVAKCQSLPGCEAIVFKPAPQRCFVKTINYNRTPLIDAASISAEMCCIRGDCHCEDGGGDEEGGEEEQGGAVGGTIAECTLSEINLPGAQLTPGYYDGFPTFESCVAKCRTTPGCRAIGYKHEAKRCFVKGAGYGAAGPNTTGRPTSSLEMCCLEGTCN